MLTKIWRGGLFAKNNAVISISYIPQEEKDLLTYKFFCFDGEPKMMYITVKNDDIWENYYDMDYKQIDISRGYRRSHQPIAKPCNFENMKQMARSLSKNIPFVRIDLYEINRKIYFSEYTFYDWAGLASFKNQDIEISLGNEIKIK